MPTISNGTTTTDSWQFVQTDFSGGDSYVSMGTNYRELVERWYRQYEQQYIYGDMVGKNKRIKRGDL